jgi:hypothetical protein
MLCCASLPWPCGMTQLQLCYCLAMGRNRYCIRDLIIKLLVHDRAFFRLNKCRAINAAVFIENEDLMSPVWPTVKIKLTLQTVVACCDPNRRHANSHLLDRLQIARMCIKNKGQDRPTPLYCMQGQKFGNRTRTVKQLRQVFRVKSKKWTQYPTLCSVKTFTVRSRQSSTTLSI